MDIRISGTSEFPGGEYEEVKVSGSGVIDGSLKCNNMKVSGSADVKGDTKAEKYVGISGRCSFNGDLCSPEVKVSGSGDVKGNLKAKSVKVSGSLKAMGSVEADEIKVSGSFSCGSFKGGTIISSGMLKSSSDIESDEVRFSGKFEIGGLLNADKIEISPVGNCRVKEIGGQDINIELHHENRGIFSSLFGFGANGKVHVETIEGENIVVENTEAEVVRGAKIIIGRGCNIKRVEYTVSCDTRDDGRIEDAVHI